MYKQDILLSFTQESFYYAYLQTNSTTCYPAGPPGVIEAECVKDCKSDETQYRYGFCRKCRECEQWEESLFGFGSCVSKCDPGEVCILNNCTKACPFPTEAIVLTVTVVANLKLAPEAHGIRLCSFNRFYLFVMVVDKEP